MTKIDDLIQDLKDEIAILQHQKHEAEKERDKFRSWWKWWRLQRAEKAAAMIDKASKRAMDKARDAEQRWPLDNLCNICGLPESSHNPKALEWTKQHIFEPQ